LAPLLLGVDESISAFLFWLLLLIGVLTELECRGDDFFGDLAELQCLATFFGVSVSSKSMGDGRFSLGLNMQGL
jgi:hypothetical protein